MEILKITLEIVIFCFGVTTLFALAMVIRENFYIKRLSNFPLENIPIKKTVFCNLVMDWCIENLSQTKKRVPSLKLKYYPHQKWMGLYELKRNECTIYLPKHISTGQVVNVIIHEFIHSLQANKNFDKMYDRYSQELGYENNPFEIEARGVAKKFEKKCLIWVVSQINL